MTPVNFTYRRASPTDAFLLSTLATQVFFDTYATNGITLELVKESETLFAVGVFQNRLCDETIVILVATSGDETVGFIDVDFATTCPVDGIQGAEVFRLYVQRPFLRVGIGRNLMAKAEALVSSKCISYIWLTAWSENYRALVFYKSIGYQDIGSTEYVIEGKGYENRVLYRELRNNTV